MGNRVTDKKLCNEMGVTKTYLKIYDNRSTIERIYFAFKGMETTKKKKSYLYDSRFNSNLTERNKDYIWQKYQAVRQEETLYSLGELHIENVRMLYNHVQTNAHGV
jgi:hypothetical protein